MSFIHHTFYKIPLKGLQASGLFALSQLGKYSLASFLLLVFFGIANEVLAQRNSFSGEVLLPRDHSPRVGKLHAYDDAPHDELDIRDVHVVLHPLDFDARTSPMENAVITQKKEKFIPQVLLITPGSTVYFLNEDNQYHNVFSRAPRASFNIGRRPPGHVYPKRIDRTGTIKIFCDIHAHMRAYVISVDTPYFSRLDARGEYEIRNLPDGRYRMEIIHPMLDSYSREIELEGGENLFRSWDLNR
ncbi:MAG: hypothetical protein R8P61_37585 [Bacteroidia bacterium]|nr:hypothetical protein [Bacteroidia bacterium]